MDEEQKYLFDVFGFIVVPDVLSQDQIERLQSTLRGSTEQFPPVPQAEGPLHWDVIWRDLLDLPNVSPILESLIGNPNLYRARGEKHDDPLPTFRLDHINVHTHVTKGFEGGMLHGGWNGTAGFYRYDNGVLYNGLTTVSFELYDTHPNEGGFACIPGSHKSNMSLPDGWEDLSRGVKNCVERISAKPGDAIIFTEALTHGTLPWTVDQKRSTVFYKYSPHAMSWSADFYSAEDFEGYDDMSLRKLALLENPNARYPSRPR
jgi:hypothetical protein